VKKLYDNFGGFKDRYLVGFGDGKRMEILILVLFGIFIVLI